MKKINKKLLLSTSLLMPILPIFATISCNNKTNDSTEQQFDLTKLETGFYNIPADYFSNSGIQLAGGFYFVLNDTNEDKMYSDLGAYYKALLTNDGKTPLRPSDEEFEIDSNYKISKPNQVAILDRETINQKPVAKTNFQETPSINLVEISVTPKGDKNAASQKTTYELKTVELKSDITLEFTAQADLYNVSTTDKANATLTLAGSDKINLSATKKINDNNTQLNKYDKVTILVKKQ